MQTENITTPFGRRPMSLALVRRQAAIAKIKPGKTADKWKIFRDVAAAKDALGIHSNSVAVLNALLTFHPKNELCEGDNLVVFPSNTQLALRAHGMSGAAIRRHIVVLVEAGLIQRKDSPNGKRYAHKDQAGAIESAFGFELSPLLARAEELAGVAQQVVANRMIFRKAKENLTICRRDVKKLLSAAMEEEAEGDWRTFEEAYIRLIAMIPRAPKLETVVGILAKMETLRRDIVNRLNVQEKLENKSTDDALIERHIQNSESESLNEFEHRSEKDGDLKQNKNNARIVEPLKAYPLSVVVKACPMISNCAPGGKIGNWRDLMSAAISVRSMLGVSPSAYQEACETMGPENAAVAVACIFERSAMISSPGGYLRDLSRRTALGEFSLGPMVMAAFKANNGISSKAK